MDFEELFLDAAPACRRNLSYLRELNEKCFADLTNFSHLLKEIEDELNSQDIMKVKFEKEVIFDGEYVYRLSIKENYEGGDKLRVCLVLYNSRDSKILEDRPLIQCKAPDRMRCFPMLESFINDYAEYYAKYIYGLTGYNDLDV